MNNPQRKECHVDLGPFCTDGKNVTDMSDDYLEAYMTFVELHVPTIRQDDKEVQKVFNRQYFDARQKIPAPDPEDDDGQDKLGIYLFLGIAIFAVLAMAIVLLIIYIRRRKTDETVEEDTDN